MYVAIGDLHGKDVWKQIQVGRYEKVVFMGDYVDAPSTVSNDVIVQNLKEIIQLKKKHPEKIVLLLGNHDIQYAEFPLYSCSGFRPKILKDLSGLFKANREFFQVAYQSGNWLFTHAGLSQGYAEDILGLSKKSGTDLAFVLNRMHIDRKQQWKLHTVGPLRGGRHKFGGITWADKEETFHDLLPGFNQVVGHSRVPDFITQSAYKGRKAASITYIDVLNTQTKFLELDVQ